MKLSETVHNVWNYIAFFIIIVSYYFFNNTKDGGYALLWGGVARYWLWMYVMCSKD